ncbi:MAG: hypothetical protein IRY95_06240, partial [Clostridia bacterium]|nr:hypothetical protein [Clostridia bacterium]
MLEGFTTAVYTVLSLAGGAFLLGLAKSAAATRDERARLLSLALLALAPTLLALLGRSLRRLLSLNWNVFWWPLADACVVLFLAVFTHLALVTVASWQGAKPPRTALLALYLPVPVLAPVYLSQWWWSGEAYRAVWGFDSDGADVVLVVLGAAYGAVALAAWRRGYGTPSAHAARWGYRGTLAALLSWVAVDGFLPLLPPAPPARAATAGLAVLPEL